MEVTIEHNGNPFKYRSDDDEQSVKYNLQGKQYKKLKLSNKDIVLDLGGHIGTFAIPTALLVKEVHSVEMDIENYKLLKFNAAGYENIHTYNRACVSNDCPETEITYYSGKWSSSISMYSNRNRTEQHKARTVTIQRLIDKVTPTVIKCDVEGAEYEIFKDFVLPTYVKQLIFELHLNKKGWREQANTLQKSLKKQGFKFEERDFMDFNWYVTLMYFER
jgi:FkbM family methyltransferase